MQKMITPTARSPKLSRSRRFLSGNNSLSHLRAATSTYEHSRAPSRGGSHHHFKLSNFPSPFKRMGQKQTFFRTRTLHHNTLQPEKWDTCPKKKAPATCSHGSTRQCTPARLRAFVLPP